MKNQCLTLTILPILCFFAAGCRMDVPKGQSPVSALIAKLMPDKATADKKTLMTRLSSADADQRREGVLMIAQGRNADSQAAREILSIMARGDTDPQVRAAALQSLAKIDQADEKLPAVLEVAVKEDSPLVRKQAVLILANRQNEFSMNWLIDRLDKDDDVEIRAESADALGQYPNSRVLRCLTDHVGDAEFSVAYRARQSLRTLTGQDFGYDSQAWRQWLIDTKQPFQNNDTDK